VFPERRESNGQKKELGKEEINLKEFVNKARRYRELRDKGKDRTQEENKEFESLAKELSDNLVRIKEAIITNYPEVALAHLFEILEDTFERLKIRQGSRLGIIDRATKKFLGWCLSRIKPEQRERINKVWDDMNNKVFQVWLHNRAWYVLNHSEYNRICHETKADIVEWLLRVFE
jgi:hypothetical protein